MKTHVALAALLAVLVALAACTAGPNALTGTPDDDGRVAGFWHGLWHGFIALFTFVISLFTDSVRVYEVHNSGNWYNFGFMLGVMAFFGGGGGAGRCSRRRESRRKRD